MRIEFNEMDKLLVPNIIIGAVMVVIGLVSDSIAALLQMSVCVGFGTIQIAWCVFWVAYVAWQLFYIKYYGE